MIRVYNAALLSLVIGRGGERVDVAQQNDTSSTYVREMLKSSRKILGESEELHVDCSVV